MFLISLIQCATNVLSHVLPTGFVSRKFNENANLPTFLVKRKESFSANVNNGETSILSS